MAPSIDKHLDLSPPPLPHEVSPITPERHHLRTETSATSGWAARLALLMSDKPKSVTAR